MTQNTNQYYVKTKIPTPNINWKDIWAVDPADNLNTMPRFCCYPLNKNIWSTDIFKKLIAIGLFPKVIRVFRWCPNRVFPWHVDGNSTSAVPFAINWVLDGNGSIQWDSKMSLPPTVSGLSFASTLGKLNDAYECEQFGHGCIVNTHIPHRVINLNNIHRLTVSMTFNPSIDYITALKILEKNNLLEINH